MRGQSLFLYIYNMQEVLLHFSIDSNLKAFSYYLVNSSVVVLPN